MGILDLLLWVVFVFTLVILVLKIGRKNPDALDIDITDPFSILDVLGDKKKENTQDELCDVCERKKGEDPLFTCFHDDCINNSDKH